MDKEYGIIDLSHFVMLYNNFPGKKMILVVDDTYANRQK
jgi:hypothetical protein